MLHQIPIFYFFEGTSVSTLSAHQAKLTTNCLKIRIIDKTFLSTAEPSFIRCPKSEQIRAETADVFLLIYKCVWGY